MDRSAIELLPIFTALLSALNEAVLEKNLVRFTELKESISDIGNQIIEKSVLGKIDPKQALMVVSVYVGFEEMERKCND